MFDRIAPTYDLLNRLLALRLDVRWRKKLVAALAPAADERILDLCAGTMDVAERIHAVAPSARVVGADFSLPMLARGAEKTGLPATGADALALPFADASFQGAAVAFGVRNWESVDRGLAELRRVLAPEGRLAILEFFKPESRASRLLHGLYNRTAVPIVGRAVSRDDAAYKYLFESIDAFGSRRDFERRLTEAGWREVRGETLVPGVCAVVFARRPQ